MTILVAGATGNVGRPLVEQLLAAGHRVRALTRNPAKADLPAGAEVVAGNLIASVAATALTTDGHAGQEYWLTGPEALTPPEKVRTISDVLGRDVRYIELTKDEIVVQWRQTGYSDEDIEFFLTMRTNPPQAGYTVLPTVEKVTGRPARTFAQWVRENATAFGT
ncbi:NAD(P)H-binding [Streptosporangium canum]|uniref:NAD(P)H-binding n=1 Tax=Streptosporangium canum TaxID=324952 RepID=A0A1I4FU67_9ACTN|nr:NAD(P)H-binding protein [Streptosporangium canum]SFL21442.1 NAD(P)H-binding [Streptosporangium canum]